MAAALVADALYRQMQLCLRIALGGILQNAQVSNNQRINATSNRFIYCAGPMLPGIRVCKGINRQMHLAPVLMRIVAASFSFKASRFKPAK